MTVSQRIGSVERPVARLFVASPSDPASLGPVLSETVNKVLCRPRRVGNWGPDDDLAGRIVLSLVKKFSVSERCLPVPPDVDSVGERWRYTIGASYRKGVAHWTIEEPGTMMLWSGFQKDFDERCAVFGIGFW